MTKDEIMMLANQSAGQHWMDEAHVQRFAALVAASEREACIKACKAQKQLLGEGEAKIGGLGIAMCIDAISTRGNK